ncbi:MAG: NAD-dependent epimerase/dehydratase family protein [Acidobacteria bacterium]|nr:NAD-dependent epimerase/dehydratase family protein [Acidobacteriota bacterium]
MTTRHVVFGCNGPVGLALMERLVARGDEVVGVCRSGRADAPPGTRVVAGDVSDAGGAVQAARLATTIYSCIGVDYTRWAELWPPIVSGLLAAAEHTGAPLIFADNLYMYGPQDQPLVETLPGTSYGRKPVLRARLAAEMLDAHASGRARVALVRASDFYGPRALNTVLGERVFARALAGRRAQLLGSPHHPHSFTYVPDVARALETIADAGDEAFGQVWHVPSAPAQPVRTVVERIYALAGHSPRLQTMPDWMLAGLALVSPLMRELKEMDFLWDRPYIVDHTKFAATFWSDYTPIEEGIETTLAWYREYLRRG